jgi:hypothetical protein
MTKAASVPGSERNTLPACRACLVLRRVSTRLRTVVTRFSRVCLPLMCVCVCVCRAWHRRQVQIKLIGGEELTVSRWVTDTARQLSRKAEFTRCVRTH